MYNKMVKYIWSNIYIHETTRSSQIFIHKTISIRKWSMVNKDNMHRYMHEHRYMVKST